MEFDEQRAAMLRQLQLLSSAKDDAEFERLVMKIGDRNYQFLERLVDISYLRDEHRAAAAE